MFASQRIQCNKTPAKPAPASLPNREATTLTIVTKGSVPLFQRLYVVPETQGASEIALNLHWVSDKSQDPSGGANLKAVVELASGKYTIALMPDRETVSPSNYWVSEHIDVTSAKKITISANDLCYAHRLGVLNPSGSPIALGSGTIDPWNYVWINLALPLDINGSQTRIGNLAATGEIVRTNRLPKSVDLFFRARFMEDGGLVYAHRYLSFKKPMEEVVLGAEGYDSFNYTSKFPVNEPCAGVRGINPGSGMAFPDYFATGKTKFRFSKESTRGGSAVAMFGTEQVNNPIPSYPDFVCFVESSFNNIAIPFAFDPRGKAFAISAQSPKAMRLFPLAQPANLGNSLPVPFSPKSDLAWASSPNKLARVSLTLSDTTRAQGETQFLSTNYRLVRQEDGSTVAEGVSGTNYSSTRPLFLSLELTDGHYQLKRALHDPLGSKQSSTMTTNFKVDSTETGKNGRLLPSLSGLRWFLKDGWIYWYIDTVPIVNNGLGSQITYVDLTIANPDGSLQSMKVERSGLSPDRFHAKGLMTSSGKFLDVILTIANTYGEVSKWNLHLDPKSS